MINRKKELLDIFKKKTGRIPVTTYGIDRYSHPWMAQEPSYHEVLDHSDKYDFIFAMYQSYYASFGFTDILRVEADKMEKKSVKDNEGVTYELKLFAPGKTLTARAKEKDNMRTVWRLEYLIKSIDDIDPFLKTDFTPRIPAEEDLDRLEKEIGDKGVIEIQLPNAVALIADNMPYQDFMVLPLTHSELLEALLDKALKLLLEWVEGILLLGVTPVFRIFGAEYAIPPYMSPDMFKQYVVKYDQPLIKLIHKYGGYARYHCHGPISQIIYEILKLNVDMLDPCEAPPNGDIYLNELAEIVQEEIVLIGNIQLDDIERSSTERIDNLVKDIVYKLGDKARLILAPTAPPMEVPLPQKAASNIITFLDSAWKYGKKL